MANVICNLPPTGEPVRYVDVITSCGQERLCVDACFSGTISVGAVKIEDGNSGTLADVELTAGGLNGLVVIPQEPARTKVNNFGSAVVAPGATLQLVSYTVPVGMTFTFAGGIIGGTATGEFTFIIGGTTIALIRNSGSNKTIISAFPEMPDAGAGTLVEIKVKNVDNKARTFEATLSGHSI